MTTIIEVVTDSGRWHAVTEVNWAALSLAQDLGPCEGASDRDRAEEVLREAVARVATTGEAEQVRLTGSKAYQVGSRAGETETVMATVQRAQPLRWIGVAGSAEHEAYDASQPPRCGAVTVTIDTDDLGHAYVPERRSATLIAALYAEVLPGQKVTITVTYSGGEIHRYHQHL